MHDDGLDPRRIELRGNLAFAVAGVDSGHGGAGLEYPEEGNLELSAVRGEYADDGPLANAHRREGGGQPVRRLVELQEREPALAVDDGGLVGETPGGVGDEPLDWERMERTHRSAHAGHRGLLRWRSVKRGARRPASYRKCARASTQSLPRAHARARCRRRPVRGSRYRRHVIVRRAAAVREWSARAEGVNRSAPLWRWTLPRDPCRSRTAYPNASRWRYCTASARCATEIVSAPARSAMVLPSLSVRWKARADRCRRSMAARARPSAASSSVQ